MQKIEILSQMGRFYFPINREKQEVDLYNFFKKHKKKLEISYEPEARIRNLYVKHKGIHFHVTKSAIVIVKGNFKIYDTEKMLRKFWKEFMKEYVVEV